MAYMIRQYEPRTPTREAHWVWLAPLAADPYIFHDYQLAKAALHGAQAGFEGSPYRLSLVEVSDDFDVRSLRRVRPTRKEDVS